MHEDDFRARSVSGDFEQAAMRVLHEVARRTKHVK
jgi:hypothetical protein